MKFALKGGVDNAPDEIGNGDRDKDNSMKNGALAGNGGNDQTGDHQDQEDGIVADMTEGFVLHRIKPCLSKTRIINRVRK